MREIFIQCNHMLSQLLEVSENLSTTPPPFTLVKSAPSLPKAANKISSGCSSCREGYADMPAVQWFADPLVGAPAAAANPPPPPTQQTTAWQSSRDDLLFADDEFTTGLVDKPAAAPYSNPLMNPGATAYAGSVNALNMSNALSTVTAPNNFKTAIGAQGLGAGTTTSFVPPPPAGLPQSSAPAIASSVRTTWMPMGLSNTQALVLATVVCTAMLLLMFIVGMGTAQPPASPLTDPLLGL